MGSLRMFLRYQKQVPGKCTNKVCNPVHKFLLRSALFLKNSQRKLKFLKLLFEFSRLWLKMMSIYISNPIKTIYCTPQPADINMGSWMYN